MRSATLLGGVVCLFSSDPDEGTTNVYLIDILESHCGTPRLTFRHFTGEEPGRWTSLGRF